MDMKQLEIFVTACERGSFSQAAACMYMTQPNISKSIRALEHELGRPLLIRNAKGVQPTAYGKIVLEHFSIFSHIKNWNLFPRVKRASVSM